MKRRVFYNQQLNDQMLHVADIHSYFDDTLTERQKESYYFKTDHHWNAEGANYAFDYMLDYMNEHNGKGIQFVQRKREPLVCVSDETFLGSWNRTLHEIVDTKEKTCYQPIPDEMKKDLVVKQKMADGSIVEVPYTSIYGFEGQKANAERLTYAGLTTNDYAEFTVYNPHSQTDKTLVVLKDSYFNAVVMEASQQFRQVTVLDPRHITERSVREYLTENTFDFLWFFYSDNTYFTERMYQFDLKK